MPKLGEEMIEVALMTRMNAETAGAGVKTVVQKADERPNCKNQKENGRLYPPNERLKQNSKIVSISHSSTG